MRLSTTLASIGLSALVANATPTPADAKPIADPYAGTFRCNPDLENTPGRGEPGRCPPEPNDTHAFKCIQRPLNCIAIFPPPPECLLDGICALRAKDPSAPAQELQTCGGFVAPGKPPRLDVKCVDDPRDDCDPTDGGADCEGVWALKVER